MDDFLYGSARISALESKLCGRDVIDRLIECSSLDGCLTVLEENGIVPVRDENGNFQREATLSARMRAAFDEVNSVSDGNELFRLWQYPYDCNNIKAVIKCRHRGVPCGEMLFDYGTVPAEVLVSYWETGELNGVPEWLKRAAKEAEEALAKTGNPQWVDLILDRACFDGMKRAADQSGNDYVKGLVACKIDLTNLKICLRLMRMGVNDGNLSMLRQSLIDGGTVDRGLLCELFNAGEDEYWDRLMYSSYRGFAEPLEGSKSTLTQVEREADNYLMDRIRLAKFIPYGAETLTAYLLAAEYEVRNLRIVLSGAEAGLASATVRERIRDSYV